MTQHPTIQCPAPDDPDWVRIEPEEVPAALLSGLTVMYYSNVWNMNAAVHIDPGSRVFEHHLNGGNALPCKYWIAREA